jgi:hypothetical protein
MTRKPLRVIFNCLYLLKLESNYLINNSPLMKYIATLTTAALLFLTCEVTGATFNSAMTGNWGTAATWTVTGVDADGIPDIDDDVTILAGHTITNNLAIARCLSLNLNVNGTLALNGLNMRIYGNFNKSGIMTGSGAFFFYNTGTITATTTISNIGGWYFYGNTTISAGTLIQKQNTFTINAGATVTNNGTVRLTNGSLTLSGSWINGAGSLLDIARSITGSGLFNCSANANTVSYNSNLSTTIRCNNATYYNLTLNTGPAITKAMNNNLTVLNNLTINAGVTLNAAGFNITLGGNWTNTANTTTTNMATVTLNGAGTQNITRTAAETWPTVVKSGTGTVLLGTALTVTGGLTLSAGTFDVSASNYALTVGGNFINNGATFAGQAGTVTLNGALAQSISGTSAMQFYNLTVTNPTSVSVTTTISLSNILSVTAGAFSPSGAGSVTLLANSATSTAKIGPVGAAATLGGTAWVSQAWIDGPATGYWQYLGTSVNGNTIADWDNDPRFYMSGVNGNDGNACCPIFRSVRTYNTATNTYSNVTSTGTAITRGRGYMVWMADNNTTLTAPLVYDDRGTPNFSTVTFSITAGGTGNGYNLVANPYACPITYSSVVAASGNLNPSFTILQENGSYVADPNGGVIAAHQGYMCIATSTGNMTYTEACKNTTAGPNIIRQSQQPNYLRINVSNDVNGLGGETVIRIADGAHNGYDLNYDLPFLASPYDEASNIWTTDAEQKDNLLNAIDASNEELDIPVTVKAAVSGNQFVSFRGLSNFGGYTCAYLLDTYTGERINLLTQDNYTYFAQAGEERELQLHLDRKGACEPQVIAPSLDVQAQVFVNNGQLKATFYFEDLTPVRVEVIDAEGRTVGAPQDVTVSNETISLPNPDAHGVYFVRIFQGDRLTTKKIYY